MFSLRLVHLIPVLLTICSTQHTHVLATLYKDLGAAPYFRNFPCPNAEDILPCTCSYQEDVDAMDMDCDTLADEQELYDVFHADIPVPDFRILTIGTKHLQTLNDTVFGDATFVYVWANYGGNITYVGPNTFINSASTLVTLVLYDNELEDFPFETLNQYTQLTDLDLDGNPISSFPTTIRSETLKVLDLSESAYDTIPAGALDNLPSLQEFYAWNTNIDSMATELFTSLPKLKGIYMANTGLIHLQSHQFGVNSDVIKSIDVSDNQITTVDADAFRGVQSGTINLKNNLLTILPEATWRPVIDAGVHLELKDNDLTCGCDVAWLVLEPTYHELVKGAQCHSGEMLVNLDPSDFENCSYTLMN